MQSVADKAGGQDSDPDRHVEGGHEIATAFRWRELGDIGRHGLGRAAHGDAQHHPGGDEDESVRREARPNRAQGEDAGDGDDRGPAAEPVRERSATEPTHGGAHEYSRSHRLLHLMAEFEV